MLRLDRPPFATLPARTLPHPWEDFASFVSRIAECMGYKNPQWVLRPEESASSVQPFNLCMLREKAAYQFFEHLLQMDETALYHLTHHRFTSCIQDPAFSRAEHPSEIERPLLTRHIFQTFFNPYSATKVCSACLREEPTYGRLYWSVLPVVACLRHNAFLVDRCPVCHCSIPLLRSSLTHCSKCKRGDYREASMVPLLKEEFFEEGQALIWHYLGIESAAQDGSAINGRASALFDLLPWQYFQLLDAFRCILGPLFPGAPFLRGGAETLALLRQHPRPHSTFSLEEWSVFIATFHWIFTAWPHNFFAFLNAFPSVQSSRVRKRDQERATGVQRDFGVFYEKWLYKRLAHPAFTFLHEAFEDYLRVHYTAGEVTKRLLPFKERPEGPIQERPYLTKVQTRALLGIGEDVLQSLLRQGILRAIKKSIGSSAKRTMFLIEKASVDALQRVWGELVPLETLARTHLGVTKAVVLALGDAGFLLPARGPNSDGYKFWLYRATDVDRFAMQFLDKAVKVSSPSPELLPLARAACRMGIALVTVLDSVLEDELTLFDLAPAQPLLRRLALSRNELQSYLDERERRRHEDLGLLTAHEAAALLSVSDEVLKRWIRQGLLPGEQGNEQGRKPRVLIQREMLDIFRRTYLFTEDVAKCLGITPAAVHKYVRKGIISPVAGRRTGDGSNRLLFLHKEVEALLPAEGLTVREAAQMLGVHPTRVYALLKSGKLTGIAGHPGTSTSMRISRSDIEAYRQDAENEMQLTRRHISSRVEESDE